MADLPVIAAVDWGSSSFRLWMMDASGRVIARTRSGDGAIHGRSDGFAEVLEAALARLAAPPMLPVIACGMVGARQGWVEAPYASTGTPLSGLARQAVVFARGARRIAILPGLAQNDPPEVMRGEETQLLGLHGRDAGLVILPGTHSKWVRLQDDRVMRFATHMTGEIFALLRQHSSLAPMLGADLAEDAPACDRAFDQAAELALRDPALALAGLFPLRAAGLLARTGPAAAVARLSGLLIGAEVGVMRRQLDNLPVTLVSSGAVAASYARTLSLAGLSARHQDAETLTCRGLWQAAQSLGWTE